MIVIIIEMFQSLERGKKKRKKIPLGLSHAFASLQWLHVMMAS